MLSNGNWVFTLDFSLFTNDLKLKVLNILFWGQKTKKNRQFLIILHIFCNFFFSSSTGLVIIRNAQWILLLMLAVVVVGGGCLCDSTWNDRLCETKLPPVIKHLHGRIYPPVPKETCDSSRDPWNVILSCPSGIGTQTRDKAWSLNQIKKWWDWNAIVLASLN